MNSILFMQKINQYKQIKKIERKKTSTLAQNAYCLYCSITSQSPASYRCY